MNPEDESMLYEPANREGPSLFLIAMAIMVAGGIGCGIAAAYCAAVGLL